MKRFDALSFVGAGRYKRQSPEELLRAMDENGVEKTVIAPVEEQIAVYNEEGNRAIAAACRAHPDRLLGYAVANPWRGTEAAELLRRALEEGLRGVYFDPSLQGFPLDDPLVEPLVELCGEYDVPIYFHTGTPAYALPFQLHFLARRYPQVRFIMGHGGANDFVADALPALFGLRNVWIETSMNLTVSIYSLLETAPDRIVFGSASPRSDLGYELQKLSATRAERAVLERVCSKNLAEVLGGEL